MILEKRKYSLLQEDIDLDTIEKPSLYCKKIRVISEQKRYNGIANKLQEEAVEIEKVLMTVFPENYI